MFVGLPVFTWSGLPSHMCTDNNIINAIPFQEDTDILNHLEHVNYMDPFPYILDQFILSSLW